MWVENVWCRVNIWYIELAVYIAGPFVGVLTITALLLWGLYWSLFWKLPSKSISWTFWHPTTTLNEHLSMVRQINMKEERGP